MKAKRPLFPVIAIVIVALAALGIAYLATHQSKKAAEPSPTPTVSATPSTSTKPSATPTPAATAAPSPSTTPSSTPITSASGAITVTSPLSGSTVTSGFKITGKAQVFEGQVNYRITLDNGVVAIKGTTQVQGDSTVMAPFSVTINYSDISNQKGKLEVYSVSAKDGSEINMVTVAINLAR